MIDRRTRGLVPHRVRGRASFAAGVAVRIAVVLTGLIAPTAAAAQAAADSVSAVLSDSVASRDNGLATRARQTFTMTGTARRYRVGTTTVQEDAAPTTWRFVSPHLAVRVSGTPVSLLAAGTTVRGATPLRARVDVIPRAGDTLSLSFRSVSGPRTLDSAQTFAIGAAGTSVLDLSSLALGVTPQVGVRGRWSLPAGNVVLGISAGAERDLSPPPTGVVFWQGTTVRGGANVTGFVGEQTVVAGAEVSVSRADSLGGRNQFPGGGAVSLSLSTSGAVGSAGSLYMAGDAFYVRPFGNERNDQPTRLIPQGSFGGVNGLMLIDAGPFTWTPSVTILREASSASVLVQQGLQASRTSLSSSAWTLAGSLSVDLPLSGSITLSPEVGTVVGTVSSVVAQTTGRVVGRRGRVVSMTSANGFADPVRGMWGGVVMSVRY